jgi:hypothetical protein
MALIIRGFRDSEPPVDGDALVLVMKYQNQARPEKLRLMSPRKTLCPKSEKEKLDSGYRRWDGEERANDWLTY